MDLTPIYVVGAALLRSILGWLKVSISDGIQDYEWKKLGETIIRVGLLGLLAAYWPGLDLTWFEISIVALGGDLVLQAVKKLRK